MKYIQAFKFAVKGLRDSFISERNFSVHLIMALIATIVGGLLKLNLNEWLWILLSITLVIAAELFNTALESLTNLVSPEYHVLARKAKDAAAAAVLVIAIFSLICGGMIFIPKIIGLIKN
ncbi:diacylglycerol kinase family protein [Olivibacter sp. SDN3]|uniref:diacylglycerol kinase family protein n=1 Tax=Olivibacter sp. SDN3 TaxID=2764720 RepID=UPI001651057F|nr:diacylglycerol kinase family protein [Olivibacter sp. SDN3]QNL50102.1 diacylglycerol kinase family protein [Olivibacter sp. SDN3]